MAFRKRNVGISRLTPESGAGVPSPTTSAQAQAPPTPGVRPSPIDGRPTTSTGVQSFDSVLAGHAGLALGSSVLIEENGTTDFAGVMLRYYAAEGLVQGHHIHVLGVGEHWAKDLPEAIGAANATGDDTGSGSRGKEKMKIAWRYERLGEFGATSRGPPQASSVDQATQISHDATPPAFCHAFDLTKKLTMPKNANLNFIPLTGLSGTTSPFAGVLENISKQLAGTPPNTIHRLVIPTLLSPILYPQQASQPNHILQFLHGLRGILREYASQLTVLMTLPLELYPRSSGLVRWMELLCDGVVELTPFPHLMDSTSALASSGAATAHEEPPQGMFHIHRLPVYHERGGGGGGQSGLGEDLAFTVSRKKFTIKPFSLPPVEGDTEAQQGNVDGHSHGAQTKVDMSF